MNYIIEVIMIIKALLPLLKTYERRIGDRTILETQ